MSNLRPILGVRITLKAMTHTRKILIMNGLKNVQFTSKIGKTKRPKKGQRFVKNKKIMAASENNRQIISDLKMSKIRPKTIRKEEKINE